MAWNLVLREHLPIFALPFLLLIGTGLSATSFSALRYGVLGGASMGLAMSFMSQDDQDMTRWIIGILFGEILALLGVPLFCTAVRDPII